MRGSVIVLALLCAGCQTKTVNEMTWPEVQALAAEIKAECAKYETPGTPGYEACLKHQASVEVDRRANARARQQAFGDALIASGTSQMQEAYQPRPSLNCTSSRTAAGTVSTSCY